MTITWTGKTTDGRKVYTAEGRNYKEVYEDINERYGYATVIDEDIDNQDKSEWSDEQYKDAIENSKAQCYYHDFEEDEA